MGATLVVLLLQIAGATPATAQPQAMPSGGSQPALSSAKETKSCREMLLSSSRLGTQTICKTKAEWRRFDGCSRATRYCAPRKFLSVSAAGSENEKLKCKYFKRTPGRMALQRYCGTSGQWAMVAADPAALRSAMGPAAVADTSVQNLDDAKVSCRMITGTGSRLNTQWVCLANREWQRMWDDTQETLDQKRRSHSTPSCVIERSC